MRIIRSRKKMEPLGGQGASFLLRLFLANLIADSTGSLAGRLAGSLAFSTTASMYSLRE